jgi:hypothetical protein
MRKALAAAIILLAASIPAAAKGDTVRIIIKGGNLAGPIEITGAAVARFNVWSGPGTSPNSPQGLIVDWSAGEAKPPQGVPVYDIDIVTTRQNPGTYKVRYILDPTTNRGYVYIPGKADEAYHDNTWLIYRGAEGKWFPAWSEWEDLTHSLIVRARKKD